MRRYTCVTLTVPLIRALLLQVHRSSDSGTNEGSRETVVIGTGPRDDVTHPRADLLNVGLLGAEFCAWSSGKSGRGSNVMVLMGDGLGVMLNPPNGVATLEETHSHC